MSKLQVTKLPNSVLIIKQSDGYDFFLSSETSIIIPINMLSFIIKFLIDNSFMSPKVLEGILEEYYCSGKEFSSGTSRDEDSS